MWRNVAAQGRIVVGVVREGKSIVLYLSQGDNESAVLACSWKQARGMRQLSARSEMGGIGFGGERERAAAGFRAVTLPTPPPLLTTTTSAVDINTHSPHRNPRRLRPSIALHTRTRQSPVPIPGQHQSPTDINFRLDNLLSNTAAPQSWTGGRLHRTTSALLSWLEALEATTTTQQSAPSPLLLLLQSGARPMTSRRSPTADPASSSAKAHSL